MGRGSAAADASTLVSVVTSPDPDGSGALTAQTTTTWYSRLWGNPYKIVDANGNQTRIVDDSEGRVSQVFKPTEIANYPDRYPSMAFSYDIPTATDSDGVPTLVTGAALVTSKTLLSGTTDLASHVCATPSGCATGPAARDGR